jgi:hypothetical protein
MTFKNENKEEYQIWLETQHFKVHVLWGQMWLSSRSAKKCIIITRAQ